MANPAALVVDDTPANHDFLVRLISTARFDVTGSLNGKTALDAAARMDSLRLAVVDMKLPDMNGLELTQALRQRFPEAYLVIATMYDDHTLIQRAFASGCNVFLVKPHGFMELYKSLISTSLDELRRGAALVIDQYGARPFAFASR